MINKFETVYLCEWDPHDYKACAAWEEFYNLYHATEEDMIRIADKYGVTIEQMKEHKKCTKHLK